MKPDKTMNRSFNLLLLAATVLVAGCGSGSSSRSVIQNKGSDTLVNVAQAWAETYQTVKPDVAIAVSGGGSGTGIAALINGTADIANSSRRIKDSEAAQIEANGAPPVEHIIGYDALAVYLHKNNPIDQISLAQLASVYGEFGEVVKWTELGVDVPGCSDQTIVRVSRQNNSGTYVYFRETVLGDGDYKLGSRDMHGSKDVVDLVQHTPCAIGYSGLAYATPDVKMPCILSQDGETCTFPSEESASDGSYPIARPLFMYTAGEATGPEKEYLDWILSDEGQCIIMRKGDAPVREVSSGDNAG